jgi:hypothetical protein
MITFIYAAIAIAFLVLVLGLFRKSLSNGGGESFSDGRPARVIGNGRWLNLSERIFDFTDARWLQEELGLPNLARTLVFGRKRLAICWLEALQSSFDELVRTPQYPLSDEEATSAGGWQMLWFFLRFKVSISYALFVVKWFGPYHRLIPSFSWVSLPGKGRRSLRRPAFANSRSSH